MAIKSNINSIRLSSEVVDLLLPSKGFYLPDGIAKDGSITVSPWDHSLDTKMVEATKKRKIDEIFNIIILHTTNIPRDYVEEVLTGDAIAISLVARSLRKEGTVGYTSLCPVCKKEEKESIKLPDELQLLDTGEVNNSFTVTLPIVNDIVELRYINLGLVKKAKERERAKLNFGLSLDIITILNTIVRIGSTPEDMGAPDTFEEIYAWFTKLPVSAQVFLEESATKKQPGYNQNIEHLCSDCGTTFYHYVKLDDQFFR